MLISKETSAAFIANVPNADERLASEARYRAYADADDALREACEAAGVDYDMIGVTRLEPAELVALKEQAEAALAAWGQDGNPDLLYDEDGDGQPIHCALTGLPIFDGDSILFDEHSGERVLKAALGVPLQPDTGEFFEAAAEAAR